MQTNILPVILKTKIGQEANDILRSCVHCGFCTATCPTYQLLGDELDSPRGRIYLIKRLLENDEATERTQLHLDRCLSCGACETTCPSEVKYRRLLDIGREIVEEKTERSSSDKIKRKLLSQLLSNKKYFSFLLKTGQLFRPLLPTSLKNKVPQRQKKPTIPTTTHQRKMVLFRGCVHDAIAPDINANAIRVLDKLNITVIEVDELRCCGAVTHHLLEKNKTKEIIKHNIDALMTSWDSGVEAIFTTASACSLMLKDYPTLMADDLRYHKKALKLIDKFKDISEIICDESFEPLRFSPNQKRIAFHSPCSLQHGLKITHKIEKKLTLAGFQLTEVTDSHLCCGSAGTYSLLQPKLSTQLLHNKVDTLTKNQPEMIATANIGCLTHIQSGSNTPVKHWITLIAERLA